MNLIRSGWEANKGQPYSEPHTKTEGAKLAVPFGQTPARVQQIAPFPGLGFPPSPE